MPTFAQLAGQHVANGVGANSPVSDLEAGGTAGAATINGLLAKVSRIFIEQTRVFGDPFGGCVRKVNDPYGVGIETAGFQTGAPNKKRDSSFMPGSQVPLVSQINYINWAYNSEVTLYDREVNKAVFGPEDAGSYAAEKIKAPLKTIAIDHYKSWLQLLSDVIDGTRSISSKDSSDGTGNAVTYAPTVSGYAGVIGTPSISIPAPAAGSLVTVTAADALAYCQIMQGMAADFAFESSACNKLAIDSFTIGKPFLFAEKKVLNALDVAWAVNANYAGFPTVSAREYLGNFADIVEVDLFPALPTNATYAGKRLAGVLMDRDGMREIVKYADVEPVRDGKNRATGYNFQGESIMCIWKGAPSYAMLV